MSRKFLEAVCQEARSPVVHRQLGQFVPYVHHRTPAGLRFELRLVGTVPFFLLRAGEEVASGVVPNHVGVLNRTGKVHTPCDIEPDSFLLYMPASPAIADQHEQRAGGEGSKGVQQVKD
ncbi:MAG: hypothetical protein E6K24_07665 [Gammaproteobacteria bacterium]|nr:MAG: hypothetical protein E6K24_07665 [Gammaproteobacteria bacterium]